MLREMKLTKEDKEVIRKKEIINEYFYHLINEAAIFVNNTISDIPLAQKAWTSMAKFREVESLQKQAFWASAVSDESLNVMEQDRYEQQCIFESNVILLLLALDNYLKKNPKEKSIKILIQKIEAMDRLKMTLEYNLLDSREKLSCFYAKLQDENNILRQHRNPGWDIFFNTVCVLPFALIISIFNRVSYGTWNPKVTRGDILVTDASKPNFR